MTEVRPAIGLWEASAEKRLTGIDFGLVPTRADRTLTFRIRAETLAALRVDRIEFIEPEGAAATFSVVEPTLPFEIAPQAEQIVEIRFDPADPGPTKVIMAVSSTDPDRPQVRVELDGEGGEGELEVWACPGDVITCDDPTMAPGPHDVGQVYVGTGKNTAIAVYNPGLDRLTVESVAFEDPEAAAAAGFTLVWSNPIVPASSGRSASVEFRPREVGPAEAAVLIRTDDRDEPEVRMELVAQGIPNRAPLACIHVKRIVRFEPGGGGQVVELMPGDPVPVIEPLDRVTITSDVRPGCTGDPDADHAAALVRNWTVIGPEASTHPNGPAEYEFEVQVSGRYVIALEVVDPLGLKGTADDAGNPASIELTVLPVADIAVEVSWGPSVTPPDGVRLVDIDAHLIRDFDGDVNGKIFGQNDCTQKCEERRWGERADPQDDPVQLVDDNGFGALSETILLDRPENLTYLAGAHFFVDGRQTQGGLACASDAECAATSRFCIASECRDPVPVQLRVFIRGEEREVVDLLNPRNLNFPCNFWGAVLIQWDGDDATVLKYDRFDALAGGDREAASCKVQGP